MDDNLKNVLLSKREEYAVAILHLEGAIQAIDDLIQSFEPPALSLDDVKEMTGSKSVEVVKNES